MKNIMVDIESLGTVPGCVVLQIGAIEFDPKTGDVLKEFLVNITRESAERAGLWVDPATEKWWSEQSDDAKKSLADPEPVDIVDALPQLNAFWANSMVWGHSTFDVPCLCVALRKLGMQPGFKYYNTYDLRTLLRITKINVMDKKKQTSEVIHSALGDCRFQIQCVKEAAAILGEHGLSV